VSLGLGFTLYILVGVVVGALAYEIFQPVPIGRCVLGIIVLCLGFALMDKIRDETNGKDEED
jgi:F0F1-type ATP synthase assembly protein I